MFNTRRWTLIDVTFVRFSVFPVSDGSSASVKELPHSPDEVWVSTASESYNQKESVRARDIVQPVGEELSCHLPRRLMKRSQVRGFTHTALAKTKQNKAFSRS